MIQDNNIIVHEVLHHLRNQKKGQKVECAVKLDMQKVYDRVEWDFLLEVLMHKGFSPRWIGWIKQCISTVSYTVLVNGKRTKSIQPTRGLWQGDPTSPYLFILVVDVLSRQIKKVITEKQLSGIHIKRGCLILHHLFFLNNYLFFLEGTVHNLQVLRSIIDAYCNTFSQGVNLAKSSLYLSSNVSDTGRTIMVTAMGIQSVQNPCKYLGLSSIWGEIEEGHPQFLKDVHSR